MCSRASVSRADGGRKILSLPSRCVLSCHKWWFVVMVCGEGKGEEKGRGRVGVAVVGCGCAAMTFGEGVVVVVVVVWQGLYLTRRNNEG
jgi:hypothetical protein